MRLPSGAILMRVSVLGTCFRQTAIFKRVPRRDFDLAAEGTAARRRHIAARLGERQVPRPLRLGTFHHGLGPVGWSAMKNLSSALPRDPRPGPSGMAARVATHPDARAVVDLYLAALREARRPHREDLVDWVAQAVLHDPLRGLLVMAEKPGEESRAPVGLCAFESSATAEHGWSGR